MNKTTQDKIRQSALFLATAAAQDHREHLDRPLRLALDIIDTLSPVNQTAADIAIATLYNDDTVRQTLTALIEGGFPVEQTRAGDGTRAPLLWRLKH